MPFLLIISLFFSVFAQVPPQMRPPILSGSFSTPTPQVGDTLILSIDIDPNWHITANVTQDDFAFPCKIDLASEGVQYGPAIYPPPVLREVPELQLVASEFAGVIEVKFPILAIPAGTDPFLTTLTLHYQACSNSICLAPDKVSFKFPSQSNTSSNTPDLGSQKKKNPTLWFLLLGAFLGGLLLNLMPCVLPVLSLKVYQLLDKAQKQGKGSLFHGSLFSAGILVSLWILALIILALREAGEQVGWGFQLQNPSFVFFLLTFLTVFTLNLFGVIEFTLPMGANREATRLSNYQGALGSFFSGVFLTLIATPCSAPFMGSAIGYALSLPTFEVLAVFSFLGLGLALPYLLFAAFPQWMKILPSPGPWMNHFKHFTAFILLATLFFLLWILEGLNPTLLFPVLSFLWLTSLGVWFLGTFAGFDKSFKFRWGAKALVLLLLGSVYFTFLKPYFIEKNDSGVKAFSELPSPWESFSEEKLTESLQGSERVFIDFTARWCLTCQVNKKSVLFKEQTIELFKSEGVRLLQADWTKKDPKITQRLASYNRSSVPVYAYYDENGKLTLLPELLSLDGIKSLF